jgi:hypothetical protein
MNCGISSFGIHKRVLFSKRGTLKNILWSCVSKENDENGQLRETSYFVY